MNAHVTRRKFLQTTAISTTVNRREKGSILETAHTLEHFQEEMKEIRDENYITHRKKVKPVR